LLPFFQILLSEEEFPVGGKVEISIRLSLTKFNSFLSPRFSVANTIQIKMLPFYRLPALAHMGLRQVLN